MDSRNPRSLLRVSRVRRRVCSLQQLCRNILVATYTLPEWKVLAQRFSERARRRALIFSIVRFSGCAVDFCLQRHLSDSDHPSYWVTCTLDRKNYMAVSKATCLQVYIVVSVLRIFKLPPPTFSRDTHDSGEGLKVEPFDFFNVYLRRTDVVLNNGLLWNRHRFQVTSLPDSLWSLLLRPEDDFATAYAAVCNGGQAGPFCLAVVVAQLVVLSLNDDSTIAADSRAGPASAGEVRRMHGIELSPSPCSYTQQLFTTLSEMLRSPQPTLESVSDRTGAMYSSMAPVDARC
ncbi:hypothetical protein V5799_030383 [Amblyomma americanum]|uniref:Uncharacterized protein n=1 Tax=Amblyomma americanum TaxID=6943 RepID=A0AAQ4ENN6_AMBAM